MSFPPPTRSASQPAGTEPLVAGAFDLGVVGEASGLARSVRNPGVIYVLDDGPGTTGVLAIDVSDPSAAGTATSVTVDGLDGRDTEGLAVGRCGRRSARTCLYIGDIGNNQHAWPSVEVWRVREPDLATAPARLTVAGRAATYTYPDAPVDAEALLVDDGLPYLVTKPRTRPDGAGAPPPRLLGARRFADGRLRDLGAIELPEPGGGGLAAAIVGNVVTGGELTGGHVVLRTYDHVLVYEPPRRGAPLRTLRRWTPREVDTPRMAQGEAVTMDGCGIWLASEQVDSIWLVPWRSQVLDDLQEQACPNGSARS